MRSKYSEEDRLIGCERKISDQVDLRTLSLNLRMDTVSLLSSRCEIKYMNDIDKLKRLESPRDARIFCLLLDPFTDPLPDPRIEQIESTAGCKMIPLLDPFPHFSTKFKSSPYDYSCLVAVWSVGEPPTM